MSQIQFSLGTLQPQVDATAARFQSEGTIGRIWNHDHTVWSASEVHEKSIKNRLGWLSSIELMKVNIDQPVSFAEEIRAAGFTHVVVLGMGGSSLCPDVCRAIFRSTEGYPQLLVLDSTHPASVARIERSISLATTLFIVASKSGGTTETNMFYRYFYDRVGTVKGGAAGENFVAITDANTQMEQIAKEKRFRRIFINPPDIGGRYSALSYFGIVPMALMGMDIQRMLASASSLMAQSAVAALADNSAAMFGIALGEAYRAGRDKLTLLASPRIKTFGYWAEQLVAESTGKDGKGILPIEGEDFSVALARQAEKRFFVFSILCGEEEAFSAQRKALDSAGHPYAEIVLDDMYDLGGEFFRWEFATAVAAAVMQLNPFDEPNVKESKDDTNAMIAEFAARGELPPQINIAENDAMALYGNSSAGAKPGRTPEELLRAHVLSANAGSYIALLAYIDQNEANEEAMAALRECIGALAGTPTTVGFGPRYLHSTGQFHKGGAAKGIFLLLTADESTDIAIPGEPFSFRVLNDAQALGDAHALARHGLPLLRVHLKSEPVSGIHKIISLLS